MADIDKEIAAYDKIREGLEKDHIGEWVLLHNGSVIGFYKSFEETAKEAVSKFGNGPYLIRQVGAPPVTLPASVMYRLKHG